MLQGKEVTDLYDAADDMMGQWWAECGVWEQLRREYDEWLADSGERMEFEQWLEQHPDAI